MAHIGVESMVSSRTKQGLVSVVWEPDEGECVSVQLSPEDATKIGLQMIEAATVAVDDELLTKIAGAEGVAAMRHLRAERDGQ